MSKRRASVAPEPGVTETAGEAERRRAARIMTITRIGQLITGQLSLDELLPTAMAAIQELFAFADIVLMLVDPDDPTMLVLRARSGIFDQPGGNPLGSYRQSIDEGVVGEAARTRQAILIADVRSDPRFLSCPGDEHILSELALPIVVGDRLLGVLNIESERLISTEDAEGLIIMADQLGVALHNATLFSGLQRALEETRLLYGTSQRIGMAMDVDDVIAAYLDQVAARYPYTCTIALAERTDGLQPGNTWRVHGRWQTSEGLSLPRQEWLPAPGRVLEGPLDAGQTVMLPDLRDETRLTPAFRRGQQRHGQVALALIPLIARGQCIGWVMLSLAQRHDWREEDLRPYQTTATLLAAAIDSRRGYQLLAEHGQQLAVLQERQRLARELHDSVTQLIFSTTLIAQSVRPAWRRDPAEGEHRISRLLELSQAALAEMRALLFELRPADDQTPATAGSVLLVRQAGLAAALRAHCAGLEGDGLPISFDSAGYRTQAIEREEALFRIAQEALANVVKHARARQVVVRLTTSQRLVRLTVADDGAGFAPPGRLVPGAPAASGGGYGLQTMRERASALGGRARIASRPGVGTRIEVTLPLQRLRAG